MALHIHPESQPAVVAFLQKSGLSLSRLGLALVMAREKGEWILGGLGQPFQEQAGTSVPSFFFSFSFLIFYKTMCPRQTGHCKLSPRPCGVKGKTPGMSSCQPHKSHMPSAQGQRESGFGWRPALPPQTLGLCFSSAKNMWYYPMVMVMPMMTAKMSTVTETQMAIMTFFFLAFFWFSRAILTCSCPRST